MALFAEHDRFDAVVAASSPIRRSPPESGRRCGGAPRRRCSSSTRVGRTAGDASSGPSRGLSPALRPRARVAAAAAVAEARAPDGPAASASASAPPTRRLGGDGGPSPQWAKVARVRGTRVGVAGGGARTPAGQSGMVLILAFSSSSSLRSATASRLGPRPVHHVDLRHLRTTSWGGGATTREGHEEGAAGGRQVEADAVTAAARPAPAITPTRTTVVSSSFFFLDSGPWIVKTGARRPRERGPAAVVGAEFATATAQSPTGAVVGSVQRASVAE